MIPIKIFIGYSRKDNSYLQALKNHLAPLEKKGNIKIWYDGDITAGQKWESHIKHNLATADIILLLISSDSLNSDYFYDKEMADALRRNEQKEAVVIPIIVRNVYWEDTPISNLQALPQDGKPIKQWTDEDDAYYSVVTGIKTAIEKLLSDRQIRLKELKTQMADLIDNEHLTKADQLLQQALALNIPDAELTDLEKMLLEKERAQKLPALEELLNSMLMIEAGEFDMGSMDSEHTQPIHRVRLDQFAMSKYLITQEQWTTVMGNNPSHFKDGDNHPIENISWDDVQVFLKKLNTLTHKQFCLPTEAQWEYAAQGGSKNRKHKYAGSDTIDKVAWYSENSNNQTHRVGEKQTNELGLYDMSGNVSEWCSDSYAAYSPKQVNNPKKSILQDTKVIRGGSFSSYAGDCAVTYRSSFSSPHRNNNIGFRLVLNR